MRRRSSAAPPPYTPAAGAKDLRAVLFNWTSYMGMLRGIDEHELIASLEYQGSGTIQVDGQPCRLTKYRASTNYQTPGQRIQYTCTRANGQTYSASRSSAGSTPGTRTSPARRLCGKREGHADAGRGAGAAHPPVGESAGRAQGRDARRNEDSRVGANPATLLQDGVDDGGQDDPDVRGR